MAWKGGEPMPSPFPGMDPYLEGARWMTVHAQLTAEIARQLAPRLRPKYVALTTERFVLDEADDPAPAIAPAPLQLETVVPEAVPHRTVEIRDTARQHLVTAIEVLSPT